MDVFDRTDGRNLNELRPIIVESGHLESVDGSCKFSIGNTCVDVSIIGPVSAHAPSSIHEAEAHLDVTVQSEHGSATSHEMYLKQQVLSVFGCSIFLNKYPLTTIYIQVQIICDNGSLLMAILNAVSIALLDSGIDCKTFPVSVSLAMVLDPQDSNLLVFDPHPKEMASINAFATLSFSTNAFEMASINDDVLVGEFKKRKRKSRIQNNDSSISDKDELNKANEDNHVNEMDLMYCDIKGQLQINTLQQVLRQCKVACFTIQFFIKRHFVESFKSLPSIYVQDVVDNPSLN